jgi:opacity protein-like surface antigen
MKDYRIIVMVLFSVVLTTNVYSQGDVFIHFGLTLPVSDFASTDLYVQESGAAGLGLNAGLEYIYPLPNSRFGLFGGIDFNYNGLQKDFKEDTEEFYESIGINKYDIVFNKYINAPFNVGFNYTFNPDEQISLFAKAGLALNLLKITDMVIKDNGSQHKTSFDLAKSFGYKIGLGILIKQKTSLSIEYLGLGKHNLKGTYTRSGYPAVYSEQVEGEIKIDLMTITLGINFE